MSFEIDDDYVDVAERIREFRTKHPEGSLQQHSLQLTQFADKNWVIYTAAAYRSADDARPGLGTAWEPVPGRTPFTRDSELQNAETAAWGRAIVAALAADSKKIATAQEVRNRTADREQQPPQQQQPGRPVPPAPERAKALAELWSVAEAIEPSLNQEELKLWLDGEFRAAELKAADTGHVRKLIEILKTRVPV